MGITVHTPAIQGIDDSADFLDLNAKTEQAILRQRKATSQKKLKNRIELNRDNNDLTREFGSDYLLYTIRASLTQIDHKGHDQMEEHFPNLST